MQIVVPDHFLQKVFPNFFHLETFLLALKHMDKLDNVHMKLMMIDSGCTTVDI